MRILVFHGYLLRGTGSNIYNANLAGAHRARARGAPALPGPRAGTRRRRAGRARDRPHPGHRPCAAGLRGRRLRGLRRQAVPELTDGSSTTTWRRTSRPCARRRRPDVALANHLVMGPAIMARAWGRALRREDPRQRARVHRARRTRSASCRTRSRGSGRRRDPGGLAPHRETAVRGAGRRAVAAGADPPRAARRGRPRFPPGGEPDLQRLADRSRGAARLGRRGRGRRRSCASSTRRTTGS